MSILQQELTEKSELTCLTVFDLKNNQRIFNEIVGWVVIGVVCPGSIFGYTRMGTDLCTLMVVL